MDIRITKTRQSIINAFIEIRSSKELERITVKELCEKAQINKSTFYAHYHDLYDLSDQLETEVSASIVRGFSHPENLVRDPAEFTREIYMGYMAKDVLIRTLFSGSRSRFLVQKLEAALKERVFSVFPQYREDPRVNLMLTYTLYGGYYAFYENRELSESISVPTIAALTEAAASVALP